MNQNLNNPDKNRTGVNRYKPLVLENNWNEDRFDKNFIKEHQPLSRNYNHLYETTYSNLTTNVGKPAILQEKANIIQPKHMVAFPGHQPDLSFKDNYLTYETETRANYLNPKLKLFPIDFERLLAQKNKTEEETK